jgi:hypothetical protein
MGVCTFIVVAAVVFIVLYIITLLLVDCDLGLAFATKVGKKVGEFFILMIIISTALHFICNIHALQLNKDKA